MRQQRATAPWIRIALISAAVASASLAQDGAAEPIAPPANEPTKGSFSDLPFPEFPKEIEPFDRPIVHDVDTRDPAALAMNNAVDVLFRLALRQIRSDIANPTTDDYRRIALIFSILQRYTPDDTERLRFVLDAWTWAGDKDRADKALRKIIKQDPEDTVLQLRLITDLIEKRQDADGRLGLYERFLGPAGEKIDDSVKSRLALDAALLYREMGDEARYVSALGLSTELDPTNKEAAALYATYFLDRTKDPIERLEVLVNVVLADPHDEQAHLNVAHELMLNGAWDGAQRFLQRVNELHAIRGSTLSDEDLFDIALTLWNASGADEALSLVTGLLEREVLSEQIRREEIIAQGRNPGPPLPIVLPTNLETIRLAIHTTRGETEEATNSMRRIAVRHQFELNLIRRPEVRPPWMTEIDALEIEQHRLIERIAARLWSGVDLELAQLDLDTLKEISARRPLTDNAIQRFDGLFAVWRDEYDTARELLEPLAENDALARLGLGIMAQRRGERDEAVRNYAHVALMVPNSAIGSAARLAIELIRDEKLAPTSKAKRLNEYADGLDPWIEAVTHSGYNFVRMTLEHEQKEIRPLDPMNLVLTVSNVSRRPLALGSINPIKSRVLLAPAIDINGITLTSDLVPEVIRMERRLRLMPGETLRIPVWAGRGWTGALSDYACINALTMRWRTLQGFTPTEAGGYGLGPLCVTTQTGILRRAAMPYDLSSDELALAIREGEGIELLNRILHAVAWTITPAAGIPEDELRSNAFTLADALLDRMETMNEYERAFTIIKALRARGLFLDPTLKARLMEIVGDDRSPLVRTAMLMTFTELADDAYIASIEQDSDADIAELARLTHATLERIAASDGRRR